MDDLLERAVAYVRSGTGLDDQIRNISGLKLPSGSEDDKKRCLEVEQIVRMLQDYVDTDAAKRPLSIVVFGPPGSGKSTFVNRITDAVEHHLRIPTANLTQLSGRMLWSRRSRMGWPCCSRPSTRRDRSHLRPSWVAS
jgi:predicted GTPase